MYPVGVQIHRLAAVLLSPTLWVNQIGRSQLDKKLIETMKSRSPDMLIQECLLLFVNDLLRRFGDIRDDPVLIGIKQFHPAKSCESIYFNFDRSEFGRERVVQ